MIDRIRGMFRRMAQLHGIEATYTRGDISFAVLICPATQSNNRVNFGGTIYDGVRSFVTLMEYLNENGIDMPRDGDRITVPDGTFTVEKNQAGPCWIPEGNDNTMIKIFTNDIRPNGI